MEKYSRSDNYVCRTVIDQTMLFPVTYEEVNFQGGILLNDVAHFIWNLLEKKIEKDNIVDIVAQNYNVKKDIIAADVDEFLNTLLDLKAVYKIVD